LTRGGQNAGKDVGQFVLFFTDDILNAGPCQFEQLTGVDAAQVAPGNEGMGRKRFPQLQDGANAGSVMWATGFCDGK